MAKGFTPPKAGGGFKANFQSRAMRPGETDVPNPAAGRQKKMDLGTLGGSPGAGKVKGPTKIGKGIPAPSLQFPAKRGRR